MNEWWMNESFGWWQWDDSWLLDFKNEVKVNIWISWKNFEADQVLELLTAQLI